VQLARKMGFRLLMAGLIDESYRGYFEKEIKPYLNDKIQYLGLVEEDEKMELISKARALLHFNTYAEGFGISLIEAMACGTPVVGMDLGSIGEVVEDGVTGFVISDISKAEGVIEKIGSIRREDCRKRVENLFTADRMVDNYEKLFTGIIGKHKNTRAK
jgi:glycosyltransferase involved in cell wall biosynthesis